MLVLGPATRAALCLFAGLAFTLSLAPYDIKFASILSIAALAAILHDQDWRRAALLGWFYGVGFFGAGVSWVYVSINVYGTPSVPLALLLTAIFCGGLGLLIGIQAALYCALLPKRPWQRVLFFAALWVVFEWARTWLLTGFPWLFAGYSAIDTPFQSLAPIVGVFGLSLTIALTAAGLTEAVLSKQKRDAIMLAAWVVSLTVISSAMSTLNWTEKSGDVFDVAIYQPNTSLAEKWDRRNTPRILQDYLEHAQRYSPSVDLIVWPESALPLYLDQAPGYITQLSSIAREYKASLVTGIPTRQEGERFNSIVSLGADFQEYRKQKLVPFGEFVPLESQLRGLIAFFDLPMSNFTRGNSNQGGLKTTVGEIAPFICYEIVYPDFVVNGARNAGVLVTISNDAWFGTSHGPHQHFQMVRFRALELQKPVIRGANNGISATININGEVDKVLPQFEKNNLLAKVQPHEGLTPYARWGSTPVVLFSLIFSAFVGINAQRQRRRS